MPDRQAPSRSGAPIQFVYHSAKHNTRAALPKSAKSHAARYGHARARQELQLNYKARKDIAERQQPELEPELEPSLTASSDAAAIVRRDSLPLTYHDGSSSSRFAHQVASISANASMTSVKKDVYAFFGMDVTNFEIYLLNHYVKIVIPFGRRQCSRITQSNEWVGSMHTELVPFALSNTAILTGIFMTSCRDLYSRGQAPLLLQLATYYKVACLNSLNEAIRASTGSFDTKVIVLAALLAGDEFTLGDRFASRKHVEAVKEMASIVGFGGLGMNGFLASLVATLSCAEDSVDIFTCK